MLIAATVLFILSTYVGYYRAKNIMLSQVSPIHTPLVWMRGRTHPWQWITLAIQFFSIIGSLVFLYFVLEENNFTLLISIIILCGIFLVRFILSTFCARRYIMKNHKKSAEAFLAMEEMKNMFGKR